MIELFIVTVAQSYVEEDYYNKCNTYFGYLFPELKRQGYNLQEKAYACFTAFHSFCAGHVHNLCSRLHKLCAFLSCRLHL